MPDPLAIISAALWPPRAVTRDDTFEGLDIGPIDRVCIAQELDEAFGIELPDDVVNAWRSVADVLASVDTAATGQAA